MVEIYKSKRSGYYPSREIAELILNGEIEAAKELLYPQPKKEEVLSTEQAIDPSTVEESVKQLELVMS